MSDEPELDLRALLLPVTPAHVGLGDYDQKRRVQDFRAVFFGDATPMQKERVLYQILYECGLHHANEDFDNVNRTYFNLGRRHIGRWLMTRLTEEPPEQPLQATTQNQQERTAT